jgi:hypothetical protein
MCHRIESVALEPNVSVEILRGPDGSEFSHRLRLNLPGARPAERRATPGGVAADKEELCLCGGHRVARRLTASR